MMVLIVTDKKGFLFDQSYQPVIRQPSQYEHLNFFRNLGSNKIFDISDGAFKDLKKLRIL
jgi:hypothetical protein